MMKRHIFFIIDYFTPHRGGSETVFENIISRLIKKGYKVSILTSRFLPSLPKEEHQGALHIYRIAKTRLRFVFLAFFRGWEILHTQKDIALIHTSTYGGAIPASLLGLCFHKKVVLTVHEIFSTLRYTYKGYIGGAIYHLFEWLIFLVPYTIYHCVSNNTMKDIQRVYGISASKIRMIHNGVDTEFRNPKHVSASDIISRKTAHGRNNRFVVLYYGHAGKSKGLDYLVDATPGVLKENKNILFVFNLIGSKRTLELERRIKSIATCHSGTKCCSQDLHCCADHPIRSQTQTGTPGGQTVGGCIQLFRGFDQKQLRTLVASADLIVAPSLSEGFGSVHTEAAAMGKPLLTTTVGPIPEVVSGQVKMIDPQSGSQIEESILSIAKGIPFDLIPQKKFDREKTTDRIEEVYEDMTG